MIFLLFDEDIIIVYNCSRSYACCFGRASIPSKPHAELRSVENNKMNIWTDTWIKTHNSLLSSQHVSLANLWVLQKVYIVYPQFTSSSLPVRMAKTWTVPLSEEATKYSPDKWQTLLMSNGQEWHSWPNQSYFPWFFASGISIFRLSKLGKLEILRWQKPVKHLRFLAKPPQKSR